jgi:CheY-like chemotaxis protein
MNRLRILIADDEIPYDDDEARNVETKKLLLQRKNNATPEHYEKGRKGMDNACKALREAGIKPEIARTRKETIAAIERKGPFDLAVIDLGWFGDPNPDHPETAGWDLLEKLRETPRGKATPIIMYSDRFNNEPKLAHDAVVADTLPLPKTYTEGSHQTLIAAIRFLTRPERTPVEELFLSAMERLEKRERQLSRLSTVCLCLLVGVGIVLAVGVAALLLGQITVAKLNVIASVLIGSFLAFAASLVLAAAKESRTAMQDASLYANRAQQEKRSA